MAKFEIFIPAQDASSFNMTLRVNADNWMAALKLGLAKLQLPIAVQDIVVDVQPDHSVSVTEPTSGRQFKITEVAEAASALPPLIAPVTHPPPVAPAARVEAPRPPPPPGPTAPLLPPPPVATKTLPPVPARVRDEAQEDRLVLAFHRATEIAARAQTPQDAANQFLDLALEIVPAEAAAVFYAHLAEQDLHVAAARGPAAKYAIAQRVPMGQGIVGTAIEAGMALSVSNVQNDPRYSPQVPESLGVRPESIASSPVQKDGRTFGALHLVNRRPGGAFSSDELEVLIYLATRMAELLERFYSFAA